MDTIMGKDLVGVVEQDLDTLLDTTLETYKVAADNLMSVALVLLARRVADQDDTGERVTSFEFTAKRQFVDGQVSVYARVDSYTANGVERIGPTQKAQWLTGEVYQINRHALEAMAALYVDEPVIVDVTALTGRQ